ncbi:allophanate hydrolase [Devosia pacifica]|uniref:Allophanate hydrolase n=1 Tax=Devosia pacifica TaxID=1335967 RepID=A0A918RTC7_9HYPH|nr:allophanate hydrolase [Devosia pacifica]
MNVDLPASRDAPSWPSARLLPLGDQHLLVRFSEGLTQSANAAAIEFAQLLNSSEIPGVLETAPNLVSVLLRYDPEAISFMRLSGEIGLRLKTSRAARALNANQHKIPVRFDGPDLNEVAASVELDIAAFITAHNAAPLKALATGFAPGFVYAGFHSEALRVPRRTRVRQQVAAGSVLFAAGQTAIAATDIPTGWHVIGHTEFRNFHPEQDPPSTIRPGDTLVFEAIK